MRVQDHYTPAFKALIVNDAENFSSRQKQLLAKIEQDPEIISQYESINYDIVAEPRAGYFLGLSVKHKKPSESNIPVDTFWPYREFDEQVYDLKERFYRLKDYYLEKKILNLLKAICVFVAIGTIVGITSFRIKSGKTLATKVETVQTVDKLKNLAKETLQFSKYVK